MSLSRVRRLKNHRASPEGARRAPTLRIGAASHHRCRGQAPLGVQGAVALQRARGRARGGARACIIGMHQTSQFSKECGRRATGRLEGAAHPPAILRLLDVCTRNPPRSRSLVGLEGATPAIQTPLATPHSPAAKGCHACDSTAVAPQPFAACQVRRLTCTLDHAALPKRFGVPLVGAVARAGSQRAA